MAINGNGDSGDLQQQVELLKQQLGQAQRLTALGELVSTTTHEFNNVLMTILNYAKMGVRHKDAATRDKCFDKILASANRAATITNTVLGMARIAQPVRSRPIWSSWSKTRCCCWNGR